MMLMVVAVIPKTRVMRDCVELDAMDEAGAMTEGTAVGEKKVRDCACRRL